MSREISTCRLNLNTDLEFKFWLAGLIDGEGNFSLGSKNKLNPRFRIILEERDKFVLERIYDAIGGKLYYRKGQKSWKPHWSPQWEYYITSRIDCIEFTKWILQSLYLKKEQATHFLDVLEIS